MKTKQAPRGQEIPQESRARRKLRGYRITVEFKAGKPPVLTLFDKASGEETESINLEKFTIDEMHELLVSRGFVRRADAADLAEVKAKEAIADEAAAKQKKERAEAAAKRRLERENDRPDRGAAKAHQAEDRAAMGEKRKFDAVKRKARESEADGSGEL
ncbi:unnamed protein product [Ectocarpus sp. CCAP 1310/34]|nr:unnamed protein product [Ectocarpus sp. CCAP 1310/34]